eukprot:1277733-Pyramimonas_sp.AAC.1
MGPVKCPPDMIHIIESMLTEPFSRSNAKSHRGGSPGSRAQMVPRATTMPAPSALPIGGRTGWASSMSVALFGLVRFSSSSSSICSSRTRRLSLSAVCAPSATFGGAPGSYHAPGHLHGHHAFAYHDHGHLAHGIPAPGHPSLNDYKPRPQHSMKALSPLGDS